MNAIALRTSVTFPVTIHYVPETGDIQVTRPTEPQFTTSITRDPQNQNGHKYLYYVLAGILKEAGAPIPERAH